MEHGHEHHHDHDHSRDHGREGHAHGHCHHGHDHGATRRAISIAFFLTAGFMGVEFAGGLLTGSMALLSDSLHMLTDAAALGMSFFAARLASLKPDSARTFGYRRAEVVAALANAMLLWILTGYMFREIYERFREPVPVLSGPMLVIAVIGLLVNIASAYILHAHSEGNINVRGAFLHVLGDLAGSVAAIAAGAVIWLTNWTRADTIVSLLINLLILFSSTRLLMEAFHILMEGAPRGLSMAALERALRAVDGVSDVHELHAWSLSSGFNALSAHLVVKDPSLQQSALKAATGVAEAEFGIKHSVFQVESEPVENSSCDICPR